MTFVDAQSLSLKQLRAVLLVGETGSVSRASTALSRSQSATTKSVTRVEKTLGVRLFDRTSSGMIPTAHGKVLLRRLRGIAREFDLARDAYRNVTGKPERELHLPLFRMEVSNQRLEAIIALHECRDVRRAADRLGVTPHAIYRALNELQSQLDLPLFERATGGMLDATPYSRVLLTHVKLAFAEVRHAIAELDSMDGVIKGRVNVGTLPPARNILIPRVINRVLETSPEVRMSIVDGDLPKLEAEMRAGELDAVVGTRHSSSDYPDLIFRPIMDAPFFVIARAGHPLAGQDTVTPSQLSQAKWIMPPTHTPQRHWAERFMAEKGFGVPSDCIDTNTYEIIEELVAESDRLAFATILDLERFERRTPLVELPVEELMGRDEPDVPRILYAVTRAHTTMSPAAKVFYDCLMDVGEELESASKLKYAKRAAEQGSGAPHVQLIGDQGTRKNTKR